MIVKNTKAFTLVELVVVAVILSILATVGFISYEDYLTDTRDSKRLSQLAGLRDGMRLAVTRGKLPMPGDAVEIQNNSTTFLYQGYADKSVLESISYAENTVDPYDDVPYTYMLSRNRKDFQLMGFLEKYNKDAISGLFSESYANIDYSQRHPNVFGKKLGILLEQETNTPLQEMSEYKTAGHIDLQDTTTNQFDAYITDTQLISGKEIDLIGIIPYTTCKKILETGGSYGDGIYNINPSGLSPFEVYCEMELDGGGWTLVGRSIDGVTGGDFGWLVSNGNVRNDESLYSLGEDVINLNFSEILLTDYTSGKNYSRAIKVGIDRGFVKDENNYLSLVDTSYCQEIYPTTISWRSPCDTDGEDGKSGTRNMVRKWGFLNKSVADGGGPTNNRFHFRNSGTNASNYGNTGLSRGGFIGDQSGSAAAEGEFEGKQGMIFVR